MMIGAKIGKGLSLHMRISNLREKTASSTSLSRRGRYLLNKHWVSQKEGMYCSPTSIPDKPTYRSYSD